MDVTEETREKLRSMELEQLNEIIDAAGKDLAEVQRKIDEVKENLKEVENPELQDACLGALAELHTLRDRVLETISEAGNARDEVIEEMRE